LQPSFDQLINESDTETPKLRIDIVELVVSIMEIDLYGDSVKSQLWGNL